MNPVTYALRREKLRPMLRDKKLNGMLISHAANRFYLSGFELHDPQCNESAGMLFISATDSNRDWLLTDPRYLDAARRLWDSERIFIYSGANRDGIRKFLQEQVGAGLLGVESKSMSVDMFQFLGKDVALEPCQATVEWLRLFKDEHEIEAMKASAKVNHQVYERVPEFLIPGRTEAEIAWDIERTYRELGATENAFAPIVAVGTNAALPHAIPGETTVRENDMVLVDTGGRFADYCSDQTRTFWVGGAPSARFQETMERVQEAQAKAIEVIKPGVAFATAYAAARNSFAQYDVDSQFTHSLGHGIGLETHEPPSLGPKSVGEFRPGMIVTAEPGLYDPQWGGIRWEYMVLVTEDGVEIL